MVDSEENDKFDLGVKWLSKVQMVSLLSLPSLIMTQIHWPSPTHCCIKILKLVTWLDFSFTGYFIVTVVEENFRARLPWVRQFHSVNVCDCPYANFGYVKDCHECWLTLPMILFRNADCQTTKFSKWRLLRIWKEMLLKWRLTTVKL